MPNRSVGLEVLGAFAAVLGVLHGFDVLVYLGIVPTGVPDGVIFFGVNWFGAILAGIVAWVWFWAAGGVWRADPHAWGFVVVVCVVTLVFDVIALVAGEPWVYRAPSTILAAVALVIALLPGTRQAVVPSGHA